MKRRYVQLASFLLIGLVLAGATYDLARELKGFGHSELLSALSLSGVGFGLSVGAMLVLILILSFDAIWLLYLVVWLIKKRFRITSDDNTLYLP